MIAHGPADCSSLAFPVVGLGLDNEQTEINIIDVVYAYTYIYTYGDGMTLTCGVDAVGLVGGVRETVVAVNAEVVSIRRVFSSPKSCHLPWASPS